LTTEHSPAKMQLQAHGAVSPEGDAYVMQRRESRLVW